MLVCVFTLGWHRCSKAKQHCTSTAFATAVTATATFASISAENTSASTASSISPRKRARIVIADLRLGDYWPQSLSSCESY